MQIILYRPLKHKEYIKYQNEKTTTTARKGIKNRNISFKTNNNNTFYFNIIYKNKIIYKNTKWIGFNKIFNIIDKYITPKNTKQNYSLYTDDNKNTTLKGTGFKDKLTAQNTIKLIKNKSITYQKQLLNTLINRAKFHPHQTKDMLQAIKIFNKYYKTL